MQRLEVSGAVRPIYASLGFKGLNHPLPSSDQVKNESSYISRSTTYLQGMRRENISLVYSIGRQTYG